MLRRCFSLENRIVLSSSRQPSRSTSENAPKQKKNPQIPKDFPSEFALWDGSIANPQDLPFDVMRRTRNFTTLHLLDRDVSKEFSSLVIDQIPKENTFVAEMNPGLGLITRELLESGVSVVHAFEKFTEFMQWLHPLEGVYPGRLQVRHYNLATLAKTAFQDGKLNTKNMDKIFQGMRKKGWSESPSLTVVGSVANISFLYSLKWMLINQFLSDYGRAVLYVAVPPSISLAFIDDPKLKHFHRAKNVLLRTFFDFKKLGTLPRKAFFPWEPENHWRKRYVEYYKRDSEIMDVVKIETKEDFFSENFNHQDAIIFYYFLAIHMRKQNTRIIPLFEKWIPGCGPRLIREDYDIYSTFNELNSEELLHLFKIFKSWPEYETSPFINFVESIIQSRESEE
ncbi:dimethyladenosine transferase 2, mitochondrial [Fopius arisanus]|uniref:Dimethyladenosine transferase 2, mitochondrial n=2 Tax=Fopius arisanus TaxID=64838 RepID=A0A9R1TAM6_9HYME|nr:PREDICTED: dimethyladenosine transferase 2, mitochondrial [Fopius arisanus]